MTQGALLGNVVRFAIPLVLTGILQLLFNAVDMIVIGHFAGARSLAAVGSTMSLIHLNTTLAMGLSLGASVAISKQFGAQDFKQMTKTVHTAVTLSLIAGVVVSVVGLSLTLPMLRFMNSPDDVIDLSARYLRIIFIGAPASMIYNFSSVILRAVGDTKRPMYFLAIAGVLNVVLNLFFVIVLKMDVAGVALGTIISTSLSAFLSVRALIKHPGAVRLVLSQLKIHAQALKQILINGLPAGFEGGLFAITNILIQSSINYFGSETMAGNAAAGNIEGFVFIAISSISQACMIYVSQNFGAKQYQNVRQALWSGSALVVLVSIALGQLCLLFKYPLLGAFTSDPDVIGFGVIRMRFVMNTYFTFGIMQIAVSQLRGIGHSVVSMLVSVLSISGLRIVWIEFFYAKSPSLELLYTSYPLSWVMAAAIMFGCIMYFQRNMPRDNETLHRLSAKQATL